MEDRNIALLRSLFERWNAGDHEVRPEELDPEIEIYSRLPKVGGVPYRGYDGVREWVTEIDEQFEEWRLNPTETRDGAEGTILLLGDLHLRGRGSGIEFDQPMAWLFEFRDGRVLSMRIFPDRDEALAAAGLEP